MTIKELYPIWYEDRQSSVKPSTIAMYAQRYRLCIENDPIADREIGTLKNSDIQRFCNSVFTSYSRAYAKSMMNLLKSLVEFHYIYNDEPVRVYKIRYPSINMYEKKEIKPFSLIEKALLTNYCTTNISKRPCLGLLIAMYTGLRIGEVCGLKWEDIDTVKGILSVRRTVERFTLGEKSRVHEQSPKTFSSARTIPINDVLRSILGERRGDEGDFVLSGRESPTEPSSMRRSFMRICKKVNVSYRKFHTMRHGYATELMMGHVDPATVSSLLGHHSASTTLNIYTHTNDEAKFLAVNMGGSALLSRV